jgi:predicted acylesterase/phospholipase RssA
MLPNEIPPDVLSNLYISATPFPNVFRGPQLLNKFQSKEDLINACMASVHIPVFMNKRVTARYQGKRYIDGSFWNFVNKRAFQDPIPPVVLDKLQSDFLVGHSFTGKDEKDEVESLALLQGSRLDTLAISDALKTDDFEKDSGGGSSDRRQRDSLIRTGIMRRRFGMSRASPSVFDLSVDDVFVIDWHSDEKFRVQRQESLVSLITPEGLYDMMDFGYNYMKQQYQKGLIPDVF